MAEQRPLKRDLTKPPKGPDGLFVEIDDNTPDREVTEQHNRDRFAGHFKFADPFTGNTRTYDEVGDYNCGRCNQAEGTGCLLVNVKINRRAGSCGDWENLCAGDPEMKGLPHKKTAETSGYGVAKNGVGFGCHRCPFAVRAHRPDSRGRPLYCRLGDFRTFGTACCVLNGAPVVEKKEKAIPEDKDEYQT